EPAQSSLVPHQSRRSGPRFGRHPTTTQPSPGDASLRGYRAAGASRRRCLPQPPASSRAASIASVFVCVWVCALMPLAAQDTQQHRAVTAATASVWTRDPINTGPELSLLALEHDRFARLLTTAP